MLCNSFELDELCLQTSTLLITLLLQQCKVDAHKYLRRWNFVLDVMPWGIFPSIRSWHWWKRVCYAQLLWYMPVCSTLLEWVCFYWHVVVCTVDAQLICWVIFGHLLRQSVILVSFPETLGDWAFLKCNIWVSLIWAIWTRVCLSRGVIPIFRWLLFLWIGSDGCFPSFQRDVFSVSDQRDLSESIPFHVLVSPHFIQLSTWFLFLEYFFHTWSVLNFGHNMRWTGL